MLDKKKTHLYSQSFIVSTKFEEASQTSEMRTDISKENFAFCDVK